MQCSGGVLASGVGARRKRGLRLERVEVASCRGRDKDGWAWVC